MAEIRAGVSATAATTGNFTGFGAPTPCSPLVYDPSNGDIYVLLPGDTVLKVGFAVSSADLNIATQAFGKHMVPQPANQQDASEHLSNRIFSRAVNPVLRNASTVMLPTRGSLPSVNSVENDITTRGSSGVLDGTLTYVTASGATTFDVAAGEGFLRTTNDQQGNLVYIRWSASTGNSIPAPAAGYETARFVGIEYNSGSPQVVVKTTFTWNWYNEFPLARVTYDGTTMRILNAYAHAEDTANKSRQYLRLVFPFERESPPEGTGGLELSETGTRNIAMSAGNIWHGFNQYSLTGIDTSSSGTFNTYYRKLGGGFVLGTSATWPNTQYDDGSGTLATMTVGRYACLWFFVDVADNSLDMMYGRAQYTSIADAQEEEIPNTIPDHMSYQDRLIGRLIFQRNASSASLIESAWESAFAGSSAVPAFDSSSAIIAAQAFARQFPEPPKLGDSSMHIAVRAFDRQTQQQALLGNASDILASRAFGPKQLPPALWS